MANSRNRGKKARKPTLQSYTRQWPTNEELDRLIKSLKINGPPIAVAILGASLLEYDLERLLRPKFHRRGDDTWDKLVGDRGLLGSFSEKIQAAFALGVIDEVEKDGLDTARRIRNAFAHSKRPIDFKNQVVLDELEALELPDNKKSRRYKQLSEIKTGIFPEDPEKKPADAQFRFVLLCLMLSTEMTNRGTRKTQSRIRYLNKRSKKAVAMAQESSNALAVTLAGYLSPEQKVQGGLGLEFLGSQTEGPKNQLRETLRSMSRPTGSEKPDSKDKR
jgi:hypothetical protein